MSTAAVLDDGQTSGDCTQRRFLCDRASPAPIWLDHNVNLGADFRLQSGEALADTTMRLRFYGLTATPLIVVAGGISAGRHAADTEEGQGWWRDIIGPGKTLDTDHFCVAAFDFLPGDEIAPKTVTPDDQARALAIALDTAGFGELHSFIGASYGGLAAMAFAARYPDRIPRLCVISAAANPDPMATALRGVQRRIISLASECGRPEDGVALARELAMTTYRGDDEFRTRFNSAPIGGRAGDPYDVCAYLAARGAAYAKSMPAARYISLSDSLDRSVIDVRRITAQCLFVASTSDRLVPPKDTEQTARDVTGPSSFLAIESMVGHDAFLCDIDRYKDRLAAFIGD